MTIVELPGGGTCTIGPITLISTADKRRIRMGMSDLDANSAHTLRIFAVAEMAKLLITEWTLPGGVEAKIPRDDPAVYDSLPFAVSDAIEEAVEPLVALLFPPRPSPDQAGTPGSPTEPTGD